MTYSSHAVPSSQNTYQFTTPSKGDQVTHSKQHKSFHYCDRRNSLPLLTYVT